MPHRLAQRTLGRSCSPVHSWAVRHERLILAARSNLRAGSTRHALRQSDRSRSEAGLGRHVSICHSCCLPSFFVCSREDSCEKGKKNFICSQGSKKKERQLHRHLCRKFSAASLSAENERTSDLTSSSPVPPSLLCSHRHRYRPATTHRRKHGEETGCQAFQVATCLHLGAQPAAPA